MRSAQPRETYVNSVHIGNPGSLVSIPALDALADSCHWILSASPFDRCDAVHAQLG
jgi:hypothetical protein